MDKNLIALVFTPTKDGNGDGKSGSIGTGFPVGRDLILTSRHAVSPENRDPAHPRKVCWYYYQDGAEDPWQDIADDQLILPESDELDAALIRCPLPEKAAGRSVGRLVDRKPEPGERWESSGFPRSSRYGEQRQPTEFSGHAESMADQATRMEVIVKGGPDQSEKWKGASGMPICRRGTDEVIGVLKAIPQDFDGERLYVVPARELLKDKAFRDCYSGARHQQFLLELAEQVARRLDGEQGKTKSCLVDVLQVEADAGPKTSSVVVDRLLHQLPVEQVIERGLGAQRAAGPSGRDSVCEVVLTILPARQEQEMVERVWQTRFDPDSRPVMLRAALPTVAELVMAAVDQRVAAFQPMETPRSFPAGINCLSERPEAGRDPEGRQFVSDMQEELVQLKEPECPERMLAAFKNYLSFRFVQRDLRDYGWSQLRGYIAEELRRDAEENNLTHYFIVSNQAASFDTALTDLKRAFPHLVLLRLNGEVLLQDQKRYSALRKLLFQTHEQST